MPGFDIIGDIHGSALKLHERLTDLDYQLDEWSGSYQHVGRQAIFVGDLIDRGPAQREVLVLVKAMVDHGSAQIVMGNHEFNALAYSLPDPGNPKKHLRRHSPKNQMQHEAFLSQLTDDERAHYLAWFRSMPLWLDLDGIRVIHACWHQPSMDIVEERLGGSRFTSFDQLIEAARDSDDDDPKSLYKAVEILLKGPEMDLTTYGAPAFKDKDGHKRTHARVKWWKHEVHTARDIAEIPGDTIDEEGNNYLTTHGEQLDQDIHGGDATYTYAGDVPVFYGHYWRSNHPEFREDWTEKTACVDFSAVKGGTMVAYRWDGETTIDPTHYHPHGPKLIGRMPSS